MSFTSADAELIGDVIAEHVPEVLLLTITQQDTVVTNYDAVAKRFSGPVAERYLYVAKEVAEEYRKANKLQILLQLLFDRMRENLPFLQAISPALTSDDASRLQALLTSRDSFFVGVSLLNGLADNFPRVCCIAGEYQLGGVGYTPLGTGFLVSPDLVLTANHVFGPMLAAAPHNIPDHFVVYFDHHQTTTVAGFNRPPLGARSVKLAPAPGWLLATSPSLDDDGTYVAPTEAEILRLKGNLDFALIKLAEPIGLEPVEPAGGKRRMWIELPTAGAPVSLLPQHRIVLPQHPSGLGLRVDFGRFLSTCQSNTRVQYSPDTAPGSSGAPCLNREFALLGIHNAEVKPRGSAKAIANQAIAFAAIDTMVRSSIQTSISSRWPQPAIPVPGGVGGALPINLPPVGVTRLWNVAPLGQPVRVIIGRKTLLDWIVGSMAMATERSSRIYAATAPAKGSGKSFSIEILQRALSRQPSYRLVPLGVDRQLLPTNLADLVKVIGGQLGVPAPMLEQMPPRPDATLPVSSTDGDKLRRWASVVVPEWFAGVLDTSRSNAVNLQEQARALIEQMRAYNATAPESLRLDIPKELEEQANGDHTTGVQDRWDTAWIALDSLPESSMTPEVSDFIAAICGVGKDEAALPDVLQRLRWLFLGYRPDFLPLDEATLETLDPANIKAEDIEVLATSILAAGREAEPKGMPIFVEAMKAVVFAVSGRADSANVMSVLQDFAKNFLPSLLTRPN